MPLEVGVEGLMKRQQGGHVAKHQLLLLQVENVEVDQGVGVRLPDQLQVLHEIIFPVENFKHCLLQLDFLGREFVQH